jgi:hypothetical protein
MNDDVLLDLIGLISKAIEEAGVELGDNTKASSYRKLILTGEVLALGKVIGWIDSLEKRE